MLFREIKSSSLKPKPQQNQIETWQNVDKSDYDFFLEMRGKNKLTILLDTEDIHYRSVYTSEALRQKQAPFASIQDMFGQLKKCQVDPLEGELLLNTLDKPIRLNRSDEQLGQLRWQVRKLKRQTSSGQEQSSFHQLVRQKSSERRWKVKKQKKENKLFKPTSVVVNKSLSIKMTEQKKIIRPRKVQRKSQRSAENVRGICNNMQKHGDNKDHIISTEIHFQVEKILNSPTLRNILKADEETSIKKIQHLESQIDEDTPWERNFRCRGNTITLNDSEPKKDRTQRWQQQILLRTVIEEPFVFQARINCGKEVIVGIVDRSKQWERSSSYRSGNAICYSSLGEIWFNQKGRAKVKKTDDQLASGSELVVKVAPKEDSVHVQFTVRDRLGTRHYQVKSQILQQKGWEFVPYFEMVDIGDSIDWEIFKEEQRKSISLSESSEQSPSFPYNRRSHTQFQEHYLK